jgi:4-nitrophenyl phosphatase
VIRAVILDLDGTVYLGKDVVPGAPEFVAFLRATGVRPLFVTNRANRPPEEVCDHLTELGMPCGLEDVLTTAQATAQHLAPGRTFAIGEEGLRRALLDAGFALADERVDYVIVSYDRGFDYGKLERACRLIHEGARLVATNMDRGLKTDRGLLPGTGAIVAAVAAGSGATPLVIGKPEPLLVTLALKRLGVTAAEAILVGDNVETDMPAGARAGVRTVLILTGVCRREDAAHAPTPPTWIADSFADVERIVREG